MMIRKISFLWVILGVLVAVSLAAGQDEEQWLQYYCSKDAREIMSYQIGSRGLKLSTDKPEGVELPELKCDKPFFARWNSPMVKGGGLLVALDRTTKKGQYDLLYVDLNGDGNLKDEEAIKPNKITQYQSYFGPVKIVFDSPDGPVTYHLNFSSYKYDKNDPSLSVSAAGWYEGDITVGTQKKHCVLLDYDANGTFDDKSITFHTSDRIQIGKKESPEFSYVGNYIEIDGKLYNQEVARDGAYIKITPAENVVYGNIKVPEKIKRFKAAGENGFFIVPLEKGLGKLPVGKYRIFSWVVEQKDDKGDNWKLVGSNFGDKGIFDVKENEQVALAVGEPVTSELKVRKIKRVYSINQSLKGRLDESIEITRNDKRDKPPKLHIKELNGTYNRTFGLEYG